MASRAAANTNAKTKQLLGAGLGLALVCSAGCGSESATPAGGPVAANAASSAGSGLPGSAASPVDPVKQTAAPTAAAPVAAPAAANVAGPGGAAGAPAAAASAPVAAAAPAGMTPADTAAVTATPSQADPASAASPTAPAKDECGLHTQYPGDDYCIKAPDPDKGWQLHIGPDDYDNVDPKYILKAGEERTDSFMAVSTNDKPVYFYYRQFRMRPGAHHNIITASPGADAQPADPIAGIARADIGGRRIGTTNHLIEDNPKDGIIAPENKGVGIPLDPHSNINVSLHSINTTDQPLLRELWVNFWYRSDAEVTEPVVEMFQAGDVSFAVQPHEDTMLGPYNCTIQGNGRMLWFYGHRHANNVRFSAWRIRDGKRDLFYEGLNWEEPLVLEYSSTVMNPVPDRDRNIEGGWSGVLDMKEGDVIEWECHVINQTDQVLRFTNNTFTGEMCIMDAELVGANCPSGFGG